MAVKVADSKGRIALGSKYAGKTFIVVSKKTGEIVIQPAVVVPEREAWLYQNQGAMEAVQRGLQQAGRGERSKSPPNLGADRKLASKLSDS